MKRKVLMAIFVSVALLLLTACGGGGTTTKTGSVSGTITDLVSDEVVEGVTVTVGDKSIKSDSNGKYKIDGIEEGTQTLKAAKNGYESYSKDVKVVKDKTTKLNFGMINLTSVGTISGLVTDGRGGPVVEGVTVRIDGMEGFSTTTDANGEFSLQVPAGNEVELLVEAEKRATMRVQSVKVAKDEEVSIVVPTRDDFNPNWSHEPPTISLDIQPGQELSETVDIQVTVDGERDTYLIYAYLGGDHRNPRTGFEVDSNQATVSVDTTAFQNGESYLKVLVYDDNENGALYRVPVTINNTADDTALPGDLTYMEVMSLTSGQNIGFYSLKSVDSNMKQNLENSIQAAPEGASLFNTVSWKSVEGADGYAIYRAFGEIVDTEIVYGDYTLFSRVPASATSIDDFSSELAANQPMMYKVVPYNSFGEGTAMERMIIPLPAFNVYLETPADTATDVSLNPTFTWRNEIVGGEFAENISFYNDIAIYDGTSYQIWYDTIENQETYDLTDLTLDPNGVYSWDISHSETLAVYAYDDFGFSYALSVAGEFDGTGSVNGEYIFTTIKTAQ